jgi:predicted TPR repeat methyltransferase
VTGDAADRVARARSANDVGQVRRVYAEWAPTYDDDVFGTLGFTGTRRIVELLAGFSPVDSSIIDLGCGTGAAGGWLAELGFTIVDGIDVSPEMLEVARAKGAYRRLLVADLTRPLPIEDSAYQAPFPQEPSRVVMWDRVPCRRCSGSSNREVCWRASSEGR